MRRHFVMNHFSSCVPWRIAGWFVDSPWRKQSTLIQLGDNCAGMQFNTSEPRNFQRLSRFLILQCTSRWISQMSIFKRSSFASANNAWASSVGLNAPQAEQASSVAEQINANPNLRPSLLLSMSNMTTFWKSPWLQWYRIFWLYVCWQLCGSAPQPEPKNSGGAEFHDETAWSLRPVNWMLQRKPVSHQLPYNRGKSNFNKSWVITGPHKTEPAGEKANHLSPALARLFA